MAFRVTAAIILIASLIVGAAAQDNVATSERTQTIQKAREVALRYTANLPNFIATETIRRSELPKHSQTWKPDDILTVDVSFSDKGEQYNLLTINGKHTKKTFSQLGGAKSDGEFGTILRWIFLPESATKFNWERSEELRGRPTLVFSYRIEQNQSKFEVNHMIVAFGGLVYVDRETNRVLKLSAVTSGFPASWRLTSFSQEIDYDFAEIGGQEFFLPLHAQTNGTMQDGSQARNEMEFGKYRKFSSEATLKFEP